MTARSPATNPFLPGSDAVPPVWAGRAIELADFRDVVVPRRRAGAYERGRIVVGEPGIGKSALVNRIANTARAERHIVLPPVRLAADDDPIERLLAAARRSLESLAAGAALSAALQRILDRVIEVTVPGGGGVRLADPPARTISHTVAADVLIELAVAALARDRCLFVRLDEVQHLVGDGLSQVLTALGDVLNSDHDGPHGHTVKLPVVVYLSGLPEFYARASAAGATFARRFKPLELGPLDDADVEVALAEFVDPGWQVLGDDGPTRVRMEPAAAAELVAAAHGSPFLFQLVGEAAWNAGSGAVITAEEAGRGVASTRRESDAHFELRLAGLGGRQRAYLYAAAALEPAERTAAAVAARLGATSAQLASTAQGLDERHRLIRRRAGRVVFRSPGLREFLRRDG